MTITIETLTKTTKPLLIDFAHANGWLRTKAEGKALAKDALVCLIGEKLREEAPCPEKVPSEPEERCGTEAPVLGLRTPLQEPKNTKPPLTHAQRQAKRKRNRLKHRRELGRRRH